MRVDAVDSGRQAMECLKRGASEEKDLPLVLCDVNMPEMDGFMLVGQLRQTDALRDVPVILLTSGGRPGDAERRQELGISDQLMKPVKQSELLEAILAAVGQVADEFAKPQQQPSVSLPKLESLNILLVEDGKANQKLAVGLLKKWGHTVTVAENGRAALDRWTSDSFDLILMDLQMPEMDGFEATRRIREREQDTGGHIPIVAMTAHAMQGDRERCLKAGMDSYVAKPIRQQELHQALTEFFSLAGETPVESDRPQASAAIDWERALETVAGDEELLKQVIQVCLDETPDLLVQLDQAIETEDGVTVRRVAHTIKASGRTFGMSSLTDHAEKIEGLTKQGELDSAKETVPQLKQEVERMMTELSARLGKKR